MCTHTPTIGGNKAADSTGKSESEICSPQDPIVYLSCRIYSRNCQHHDREASWDLVAVGTLKIRFKLWYRPTSWFRPPYAASHPPPATRHPPPASRLPVPGACSSASLCTEHTGAYMGAYSLLRSIEKERRSSIVYRSKERENYRLIYERVKENSMPTAKAGAQSRALLLSMGAGEADGGGHHRPHARVHRHRRLRKPPG